MEYERREEDLWYSEGNLMFRKGDRKWIWNLWDRGKGRIYEDWRD